MPVALSVSDCAVPIEIGREQNRVVAEARVHEQALRDDRVPQPLVDVEDVFFVARRVSATVIDGAVQETVRLVVPLPRIEAGELVLRVQLIREVDQPGRDVRLIEHRLRQRRRRVHVDAPVAERSEHAQLVLDDRAADAEVDVRDEVRPDWCSAGSRTCSQVGVDVRALGLLAFPGERRRGRPTCCRRSSSPCSGRRRRSAP